MSEINTEAPANVRSYRHKAVGILKAARKPFERAPYGSKRREAYYLLNGTIETILAGRPGLSQEEQVEHLNNAREKAEGNFEVLSGLVEEAIEEAKEAFSPEAKEAALERAKAKRDEKVAQVEARYAAKVEEIEARFANPEEIGNVVEKATPVLAVLAEAADFAAERDFEAWQEAKRARFYGEATPETDEVDAEDGDED